MDNLVKQRRSRVSISENKQSDLPRLSELAITDNPALNWLKNQSYWYEKNDYYNEKESEFAVSVVATAFVIKSMVEAYEENAKRIREEIKKKTNPRRVSEKKPMDYPPENRRAQEIGSSSRTLGLASAPSKADSWEKSQINKIRIRYEKMKAEIVGWENERKLAAKLRMEKRKSELQKRIEMNNQHHKSKLARIQLISDGAKKQLEEKKRSEESRVEEKIKKLRRTGKVPINYFCFRGY